MKKILPILMLLAASFILSSCIVVAHETPEPTYKFYFVNNTSGFVYDWYLKDSDGDNHAKSNDYCDIAPGEVASKSGLYEDDYQLWFCPLSTRAADYYWHSGWFELDDDTTFYLASESFYEGKPQYRAVTSADTVSENDNLVIMDSKGNVIPLYKAGE